MNHLLQKARNFGLLGTEQVVRLGIGFIVTTAVARKLGPEGFAAYSYVFALLGIAIPIARYGSNVIVVRELAADRARTSEVLGSLLAVCGLVTLLAGAGLLASFPLLGAPPGVDWNVLLLGSLVLLATPGEVFFNYARAVERFGKLVGLRIAIGVVAGALTFLAASRGAGVWEFVALRGGEAIVLGLSAWVAFLLSAGRFRRLRFEPARVGELLRDGLPIALTGLASMVLMRIDQVMLGQLGPAADLGRYGVAVRVAEIATFVPVVLYSTLYPAIVRNHARDPGGFDRYAQRVFDTFALVSLPVAGVLALASWLFLVPLFGADYAEAVPMTLWMLAAMPFVFLQSAMGAVITARGWRWTGPALVGAAALFNVGLNLWLIPAMGGLGAAIATAVTYVVLALVLPLAVPALRPAALASLRAVEPVGASLRLWRGLAKGEYTPR